MKRIANLYDSIWEWQNLRAAFHAARRGASRSSAVREFEANLDENLRCLGADLRERRVRLEGFTQFVIHDPKERTITAPAFRDRVLHHAVIRVCEPFLERGLVDDTYACRKGKGCLAALERATGFARRHGWFLKLDVRKYFESIPHGRLLAALEKKFKDRSLLGLLEKIVRSHEAAPGRGLPIGSLTSQHLANFYLGAVDRFAREHLRVPGYLRYMDDFALWHDDRARLRECWREIGAFLPARLGLELKSDSHLNRTSHGMNLCGFRIFPGWRALNRRSRRRLSRRLAELELAARVGNVPDRVLQARASAIIAFAREGKSWQVRHRALARASTA